MRLIKIIVAVITITVGGVGVALSGGVIVWTKATASQLEQDMPMAIEHIESVLGSSLERTDSAQAFLQTTRERLAEIRETVAQFAKGDAGRVTIVLDNVNVNVDVADQLEQAELFVKSLQSGLQSVSSMMMLIESVPFLAPRGRTPTGGGGNLKTLASEVTAFNETLDRIAATLSTIRSEGRADPQQVAVLEGALQRADSELQGVHTGLQEFSSELNSLNQLLADVRTAGAARIRQVAAAVIVFFACFGFSQLNLVWRGLCCVVISLRGQRTAAATAV